MATDMPGVKPFDPRAYILVAAAVALAAAAAAIVPVKRGVAIQPAVALRYDE